jgi:hypothetical protein
VPCRNLDSDSLTRYSSNLVDDFVDIDIQDLGDLEELDEVDATAATFHRRYHRLVSANAVSKLLLRETGTFAPLHQQVDELEMASAS